MLKALALVAVTVAAVPSQAAEEGKQQKIDQIIRAIGLRDMFEQQIERSRASYLEFAKHLFAKMEADLGMTDPVQRARLDAIMQNYMERGLTPCRKPTISWRSGRGCTAAI
jgi:hypothetical protein